VDAQTVRNVKATQEGQKIAITYELSCAQPTEINLFLSEDNGMTWYSLKTGVSGDVGLSVTQGNKVIYWDVLLSKEKMVGNTFVFKVKAGEEFKTVKIGNQIWLAENLNVDHYRNGDRIQEVIDAGQWAKLNSGAWCYFKNDNTNGKVYGKLYNWYTVNDARGLCPVGWHVSTEADWSRLEIVLKTLEDSQELNGINMRADSQSSAFFSLFMLKQPLGGYRNENGFFYAIEKYGFWWSNEDVDSEFAFYHDFSKKNLFLSRDLYRKQAGFSVRCVRD
jgi:uncharacterized protein (TIGR02145 family)